MGGDGHTRANENRRLGDATWGPSVDAVHIGDCFEVSLELLHEIHDTTGRRSMVVRLVKIEAGPSGAKVLWMERP
jgi:hypothetical protein